jgi:hypothetical protein
MRLIDSILASFLLKNHYKIRLLLTEKLYTIMGCNCKKKYDALKEYSDDPTENSGEHGIFHKIMLSLAQLCFGILLAPLIIVIMVLFLAYLIVCLIFGINPKINLKIPFKKKR